MTFTRATCTVCSVRPICVWGRGVGGGMGVQVLARVEAAKGAEKAVSRGVPSFPHLLLLLWGSGAISFSSPPPSLSPFPPRIVHLSVCLPPSLPLFRYNHFAQGPSEEQGRPAGHGTLESCPQPFGYLQVQVPGPSLPTADPAPGRQPPKAGPPGGGPDSTPIGHQQQPPIPGDGPTAWVPKEGRL